MTSALLWTLIGIPLGAGGVLATLGRRAGRAALPVGLAAAALTVGLGCAAAVVRPVASAPLFAGIDAGLRIDNLSAVMVVTVSAVTVAVLVFAAGEPDLRAERARFFGLMLLFAGAMLVTVTATTLALLLMGWEVMGAVSWALIGFWWREPPRVRAAHTAFFTTRAADLGLYLAAGAALAGGVASLRLEALPAAAGGWLTVLSAGVLLAAAGKSAQLPFSFWLSRAMQGPSPVSALLHSATMVAAGAYLLLRLQPLLAATAWAGPLAAWIGALTALLLGLVAVAQTDLKQLLAASTCAQVGFMVLAAGGGAVAAGTGQWVAHAATKSLLFLGAGAWLTALGSQQLPELRGAARRLPLVGVTFTAGVAILAGLPPFALWTTKDQILASSYASGPSLYAVGLAAAVVSTVYSVKAGWYLLRPVAESQPRARVPLWSTVPLVSLAVAAVGLSVLGLPGLGHVVRDWLGAGNQPAPPAWQIALSATVVVAAAALTWRLLSGRASITAAPGWLTRWLALEILAQRLVAKPTLALARMLAVFDDRVLDRAVHEVARGGLRLARVAGRYDDRGVDGAVRALTGGARRLGRLARRPQTGLLHQYYAQFAVALAVLALFLLIVR